MGEHLLMTLPFPKPEPLIEALHGAFPDMKITYVRHEVKPAEAFFKQDVDVPPEILREATCLATFGFVPDPSDAPNLRYIHFAVAGTDHVSHKAAFTDPGMAITTSAGASSIAVAEWVVGSVLALTRRLLLFREMQGEKVWGKEAPEEPAPFTLDGKRMGIVGYGSIGRQVARLAHALGMDVVVYNSRPRVTAEDRRDRNWFQPGAGDPDGSIPSAYFDGQSKEELAAFLGQGIDVLVLALPLTPATKHLIGEEELAVLNASGGPAILVNVSRGQIVEQDALIASLKKGAAGGGEGGLLAAALDVTDPEPLPAESELWGMPNVFVTPHVSGVAQQTVLRALGILRENLGRREKGEGMVNVVKRGMCD
ncbi:D-2-hydroxyacid dehydrogenase [Trichoderma ghanense]|uniref:D-2-hydroxyacid dehydrogenase n=1 Tax=Trichoderma ghanense TaxID=65468 RepID=A0ABY2GPG5_9HYPO